MPAAGNGRNPHANGAGALDIERGIADDPNLVEIHVALQVSPNFRQGIAGDIVALEVVIAESPEREVIEQPIVSELEPGAVADIAGEETQSELPARP